jgi:hypothetical protein
MKELERRWRDDMPEIPLGEYNKCKAAVKWAEEKMEEVLEAEYGFNSKGDEL